MSLIEIASTKFKRYFSKEATELRRLLTIPRYQLCNTTLLGGIQLTDSVSFVAGYEEIFKRENYKFSTDKKNPFIIDCGSNIGLSLIYFKQLFPAAQIICFEPDPAIFSVLKGNSEKLGLNQVTLLNKALSDEKGNISFVTEGGFSGRIADSISNQKTVEVEVDTLSQYINREVDFLKIDIEGHELRVLQEIESKLQLVHRLFIEYHSMLGEDQPLDKILIILKNAGYRVHIKEAGTSAHPFIKLESVAGMDNQLEIYAWRP